MSGIAAVSGISSHFSPAPRFSPFPHAPPPRKVAWASLCPVSLGRDGTPSPAIPGGLLAPDFQKPRRAGRIPIYETASQRERLPHPEAEAGFRRGGDRGVPRPEPKETRTAGRKGSSRDPGKAASSQPLGVAGKQPQDPGHRLQEGDSHGTIWGSTDGNQPDPDPGPGSHSCP